MHVKNLKKKGSQVSPRCWWLSGAIIKLKTESTSGTQKRGDKGEHRVRWRAEIYPPVFAPFTFRWGRELERKDKQDGGDRLTGKLLITRCFFDTKAAGSRKKG